MTMTKQKPRKAFILAAGKGTRLRPYTDTMPKPMVNVGSKAIIDWTLEHLREDGVTDVVVNLSHLGSVLEEHLNKWQGLPKIHLSWEDSLLETGGGVRKMIDFFGNDPFYLINGDALWTDGPEKTAFEALTTVWDAKTMDILLLLQPVSGMSLTKGVGDYVLSQEGRAQRALQRDGNFMFAGVRIVHPCVFNGTPADTAFSFLELMDKAEKQGRLFGIAHDGEWHHISTPDDLKAVHDALSIKQG